MGSFENHVDNVIVLVYDSMTHREQGNAGRIKHVSLRTMAPAIEQRSTCFLF